MQAKPSVLEIYCHISHHFLHISCCCRFVEALTRTDLKASEEDTPEVTDGIDISNLTKPIDNETSIEYSIWDFAGQSVYYNTHQVNRSEVVSIIYLSLLRLCPSQIVM